MQTLLIMRKLFSVLLMILLSAVGAIASGGLVVLSSPMGGAVSGDDGSDPPTVWVTEGAGCRPPRPGGPHPPLAPIHYMPFQSPGSPQVHQATIGLGYDFTYVERDGGRYAFYLSIDSPLGRRVYVTYYNQTDGRMYRTYLDPGSTLCWVPVEDPLGSWMVEIGTGNVGYFNVTSDMFYDSLDLH